MSSVLEIEKAIEALPKDEFLQLMAWLESKREEAEDAFDNSCSDDALAENGSTIPWEHVQRECGLLP